eukprot:scaffold1980_cov86-Skeletonema_marinoi.AAC.5
MSCSGLKIGRRLDLKAVGLRLNISLTHRAAEGLFKTPFIIVIGPLEDKIGNSNYLRQHGASDGHDANYSARSIKSNAAQPTSLINNNTFMTKCWPTSSSRIASDIFHATSSSASSTPTVTPPFTIELVDDIPFAALPTIQNSTAPPRMKTQGSGGGTGGGKRGCMNPFALPIKKRFNAAAKKNMMSEGDDGQQPCGEMKQSAALSSTIAIA